MHRKRHKKHKTLLCKPYPESLHCRYRKRQLSAFARQRRTARETSDSAGRVWGVIPRAVLPEMPKHPRANDVRPYSTYLISHQTAYKKTTPSEGETDRHQQCFHRENPVFHIGFNTMWKSRVEKKPGSAKAKPPLPHLPCGNQPRKLWNLFSTACRNCFSHPAHIPRISPQVFPFHSTIFPHSNTPPPLSTFPQSPHTTPVEKKHGICGRKGRFPLFRPTNTTTIFLFLCFLCFAASLLSHKDALFCFSEHSLCPDSIHSAKRFVFSERTPDTCPRGAYKR